MAGRIGIATKNFDPSSCLAAFETTLPFLLLLPFLSLCLASGTLSPAALLGPAFIAGAVVRSLVALCGFWRSSCASLSVEASSEPLRPALLPLQAVGRRISTLGKKHQQQRCQRRVVLSSFWGAQVVVASRGSRGWAAPVAKANAKATAEAVVLDVPVAAATVVVEKPASKQGECVDVVVPVLLTPVVVPVPTPAPAPPAPTTTNDPTPLPSCTARLCACKSDPEAFELRREMAFKVERTVLQCTCEHVNLECGSEVATDVLKDSIGRMYRIMVVGKHLHSKGFGSTFRKQAMALDGIALQTRLFGPAPLPDLPAGVVERDRLEVREMFGGKGAAERAGLPRHLRYRSVVRSGLRNEVVG